MGNYDHHMDMRLDIEDMSYEVGRRNPAYISWTSDFIYFIIEVRVSTCSSYKCIFNEEIEFCCCRSCLLWES